MIHVAGYPAEKGQLVTAAQLNGIDMDTGRGYLRAPNGTSGWTVWLCSKLVRKAGEPTFWIVDREQN